MYKKFLIILLVNLSFSLKAMFTDGDTPRIPSPVASSILKGCFGIEPSACVDIPYPVAAKRLFFNNLSEADSMRLLLGLPFSPTRADLDQYYLGATGLFSK